MQRKSWLAKILLSPLALLYGTGVSIRNQLYDWGMFKSVKFQVPVISVGNLTTGGTGKTPHIEWLIRELSQHINVSVLSRGYRRKSKGFLEIYPQMKATDAGDEPLQLKRKFPQTGVFVCENRLIGIPKLLAQRPETQMILLDDAFQHRAVTPTMSLLLTEYNDLFVDDAILPVGNLREWKSGVARADVIIVTKCPTHISEAQQKDVAAKLSLSAKQKLFFSRINYAMPYDYFTARRITTEDWAKQSVLLVAGIAKPAYISSALKDQVAEWEEFTFPDHHDINKYEWGQILKRYEQIPSRDKMILCTEKDAVKFNPHRAFIEQHGLRLCILPIRVQFFPNDYHFWQFLSQSLLNVKL